MSFRLLYIPWLFSLLLLAAGSLSAQPQRLNYFPAGDSLQTTTTVLDPGDLLLQQGILVTNQFPNSDITFQLSFDRQAWASFGLGPQYSSIFSLQNYNGCYFEVTTAHGPDQKIRKEYLLNRGSCYSIYWNAPENCWDMKRNPCRRR